VQLAAELGAAKVIGTTRSCRPAASITQLGLDHVVVTSEVDFADEVLKLTGGAGVDIIIDRVGGPQLSGNIRAAALQGRIVGAGRLGDAEGTLNMEELARKRLEIIGTTFRTRTIAEKARIVKDVCSGVDPEGRPTHCGPSSTGCFHGPAPWRRRTYCRP
jgi:NADPH:quinone reductase-like Zn-dependent oxidoreductase